MSFFNLHLKITLILPKRKVHVFWLALLAWLLVNCSENDTKQKAFAPKPVNANEILGYLHNLLQEPELAGASLGFYVTPLEKDSAIVAYMPDVALATASTLKAVTTATALGILGSDYRFETQIAYSGKIDASGTLQGNLYLIGSGDPSFGSDNMPSLIDFLANRVIEKGIKKINGQLIGDASIFDNDGAARTWIWEDIGNYYGASPSGLSIHQNQYSIYFKTGRSSGEETKIVEVAPKIEGLNVRNEVVTGEKYSGDNAYIFGGPFSYEKIVRGTLPPNYNRFMIKGAMPEPAKFCTSYFLKTLEAKGVQISESFKVLYERPLNLPKLTKVYTYQSPPLSEIIKQTNYKSINLYADALLKKIGHERLNEGNFEGGIEVLKSYWANKGVDTPGLLMHDGSGLSRYNAVSALSLSNILRYTIQKDTSEVFLQSLPVAGVSGTLKNICKNHVAKGRISAKSGYIKNVRAYTGLVNTYSNKRLIFTLLINNHTKSYREMTPHIEEIFNLLTRL